jgi:hypothetical protein
MFENGMLREILDLRGWRILHSEELHNFTVIDSENACGSNVLIEWVPMLLRIQKVKSPTGTYVLY